MSPPSRNVSSREASADLLEAVQISLIVKRKQIPSRTCNDVKTTAPATSAD